MVVAIRRTTRSIRSLSAPLDKPSLARTAFSAVRRRAAGLHRAFEGVTLRPTEQPAYSRFAVTMLRRRSDAEIAPLFRAE